jgi:hypothetical protein
MRARHTHATCPVCSRVGEYVEIDNAQDPSDTDVVERFPPEAEELQVPNEPLAEYYRYVSKRLLKCVRCGTYYWYRQWAPGGSEDVLHTYIHESLRRIGFLEAHVELHDARFQAYTRAQEYGGVYVDESEATRRGVEAEMALLRARHREIVSEAVHSLEHKYRGSDELARTLELYSPGRDHSRQIEEGRARDREIAVYHAGILAEYLPHWETSTVPAELIHRLVNLLADDDPRVGEIVKDALLRSLRDVAGQGRMAREVVAAAEGLAPRYAEVEALLDACAKIGGAAWWANRRGAFPHPGKE